MLPWKISLVGGVSLIRNHFFGIGWFGEAVSHGSFGDRLMSVDLVVLGVIIVIIHGKYEN